MYVIFISNITSFAFLNLINNSIKMNKAIIINRASKLFQPFTSIQKNAKYINDDTACRSTQLMLDNGIIRQSNPGIFHLLPIGVRVLDKLTKLVDSEMKKIDAQKLLFPTLTNAKLWKVSGRYDDVATELFKLKDRHNSEYLLSPTHEETAADLISSLGLCSYKKYPLKLYQVTSKFRDEMKPRFGLMRARQFIMKDLYTFDTNVENARATYEQVCESYDNIFEQLSIGWVKVLGSSGTMGGDLSHEYHLPAEIGEDKLIQCNDCKYAANLEYLQKELVKCKHIEECPNCQSKNIAFTNGIEAGHTFLLGQKYSKPLNGRYLDQNGKSQVLEMGSYGLGVSRIIAASVEILSKDAAIQWPYVLRPFTLAIIGPKSGSKEETTLSISPEVIYLRLNESSHTEDDVLYDDRTDMTIGKRLLEAKRTGYPFVVVLGKKATQQPPLFELINVYTQEQTYLSLDQLVDFFNSSNQLQNKHLETFSRAQ